MIESRKYQISSTLACNCFNLTYLGQFGVVFLDEVAQVAGGHSNEVGAGPGVSGNVHFAESAVGNGVTEGSATQSINHLYWSFVRRAAFIRAIKGNDKASSLVISIGKMLALTSRTFRARPTKKFAEQKLLFPFFFVF